jgi:hypothetical protein
MQVTILDEREDQDSEGRAGGRDKNMSNSAAKSQIQKYRPTLPEADEKDVLDRIDLSTLSTISSDESALNHREDFQDPITGFYAPAGYQLEFFYNEKIGRLLPRFVVESARKTPKYINMVGQRVEPTRIISLLTQNPGTVISTTEGQYGTDGPRRPASQIYWWRQPDEGYYTKEVNKNLVSFLAETEPNYYIVEGNSKHRLKFKCPRQPKGIPHWYDWPDDNGELMVDDNENVELPKEMDDISIYIDPDNDRARWACPRCTAEASRKQMSIEECKILGHRHQIRDTVTIFHDISRTLRIELASDRFIPGKEYKYKDRLNEAPKLLKYIARNQGMSLNELDKAMEWPHGTAERIITTQLGDKVDLRKGRKGYKGYKAYIYH